MVCEFCSTARDEIEKLNDHLKEDDELMQLGLKRLNELQGEIVDLKREIRELEYDLGDSVSSREVADMLEEAVNDAGYVR